MLLSFEEIKSLKYSLMKKQLVKLIILLIIIISVHVFLMIWLEKKNAIDALWLTMTTITTVGYGDHVALTAWGRVFTVILIYIFGIGVLAQAVSIYFACRREIINCTEKGERSWKMKNHIVFINCPSDVDENFFLRAIRELRNSADDIASKPIIIVDEYFRKGISDELKKLNVRHVSKPITNDETFEAASICKAHTIVILSKNKIDPVSDSINFELIDRLRGMGIKCRILVEVVNDNNRLRMKRIGADNVMRPIRTYPEFLMRAIIAPGSEEIMETLFNSTSEECIRYNIDLATTWKDVVIKSMDYDIGIPVAFVNKEDCIINNPHPNDKVIAKAIFMIVRSGNIKKNDEISKIMHNHSS